MWAAKAVQDLGQDNVTQLIRVRGERLAMQIFHTYLYIPREMHGSRTVRELRARQQGYFARGRCGGRRDRLFKHCHEMLGCWYHGRRPLAFCVGNPTGRLVLNTGLWGPTTEASGLHLMHPMYPMHRSPRPYLRHRTPYHTNENGRRRYHRALHLILSLIHPTLSRLNAT